jgi:DNA-damage-inducible protein J
MMMTLIAAEKELPFKPRMPRHIPNAETIAALRELDEGGGKTFATVEELMADLKSENEDD